MTTDPTPLQESIARAIDPSSWRLHDSGTFPPEHQASQAVIRRSMDDAAAVLPIIAAEVRKAQADAAREALDGLAANMTRIANETPDALTRTAATITARLAGEYKTSAYPKETP